MMEEESISESVPVFLSFSNIYTSVDGKKILQDVSGKVKPGEVLAVMGPSGAGKSTLLNVLSGRLKADSGEVSINGRRLSKRLKRKICYVLQEDIFFSHLTLKETLTYSAMLRLPDTMTKKEKLRKVDEIVDTLDIRKCLDTAIGSQMERGLSGGEKKRANIGCELITNPSLIFLDEPTSGLDSSNAFNLMTTLKNIAVTKNKTTVATIHQPSSQIFYMFDKLLLLCNGQIAYSGSPSEVLDFFEEIDLPCEPHYNPADFILEKVNSGKELQDRVVSSWSERRKRRKKSSVAVPPRLIQDTYASKALSLLDDEDKDKTERDSGTSEDEFLRKSDFSVCIVDETCTEQDGSSSQNSLSQEEHFVVWERRSQTDDSLGLVCENHRKLSDNSNSNKSLIKSELNDSSRKIPNGGLQLNGVATLVESHDPPGSKVSVVSLGKRLGYVDKNYTALDLHINNDGRESRDEDEDEEEYGHISTTWVTSFSTQFTVLLQRNFKQAKPEILSKINLFQTISLAVIVAVIWFRIPYEEDRIRDRYAMLFFIVTYWGFNPLFLSLLAFPAERLVINKERASGYYRLSAYYLSKTVSELPLVVFQPTLFLLIVYWATGLNNSVAFLSTLFAILISAITAQSTGFFIGALALDFKKTLTFASLFMLSCMLLGGFYQQHIPSWLGWMQYLGFITYSFNAVMISEYETSPPFTCNTAASAYKVCQINGTAVIKGSDVMRQLDLTSSYGLNIAVLFAQVLFFRIITYLVLRYWRRPK